MIGRGLTVLRWCLSLGKKFIIVAPWATLAVIAATLVSQVGVMLTAFLPLKIVILLGSDRIPRYFPASFAEIDRPVLLAGLSLATVGAFVAHVAAERLSVWSAELGARALLARSQKMALFENQDELALSSYQRYSRALAGVIFAVLVFLLIALVYPKMALVLAGYIALLLVGMGLFWRLSERFHETLEDNLGQFISTASNIGFLVGFLWLVIDFVALSPPGMLVAIISLLFSRLALQRLGGFVTELAALNRNRIKLDALYFHGKALSLESPPEKNALWPLLLPERRGEWIAQMLAEHIQQPHERELDIRWHQLKGSGVGAFTLNGVNGKRMMVKLFDRNKSSRARHEAELLGSAVGRQLPAPRWVGAGLVEEFSCHLLELNPDLSLPDDVRPKDMQRDLAIALMPLVPSSGLVQRYVRSRPLLWQRLHRRWFEQLHIAAESPALETMAALANAVPDMVGRLQMLPLVIVNPAVAPGHLLVGEDGRLVQLEWGRWSLDPVGSGWPAKAGLMPGLDEALVQAGESRKDLVGLDPGSVRLAALLSVLESLLQRGQLADGVELALEMPACLESADGALPHTGTDHA